MSEYSYYLLGTQRRNIGGSDSVVGQATEDLSDNRQYLLIDSTGDCTFFLQYSTDEGVTWNDYPNSEGWSVDNSAKIYELLLLFYLFKLVCIIRLAFKSGLCALFAHTIFAILL